MCEVDVFEHHRFCDEFSHLVKTCFVAKLNTLSVEVVLRWIKVVSKRILNFWLELSHFGYELVVIIYFFSLRSVCEVDVFEHHRFCDEFSHLLYYTCFVAKLASASFSSMEKMFKGILNVLLNCHIYYEIVLIVLSIQFNKCVK